MNERTDQHRTTKILGVDFFNGSVADAVQAATKAATCVAIPAAPSLVKLNYDEEYRRAIQAADLVLADSGLLALLSHAATGRDLSIISGIDYLRELLRDADFRNNERFWIVRSEAAKQRASEFLRHEGIPFQQDQFYVAAAARDSSQNHAMLLEIEARKSRHVVIAITRGAEELGIYLRDYLLDRPRIHCVGNALALLSGDEKPIPAWAQRLHLGSLARAAAQPSMFFPRIGMAATLVLMVFRYRSEMPTLRARWTEL